AALLPALVLLEEAADDGELALLRLDVAADDEEARLACVFHRNEDDRHRDGVRPHRRLAAGAGARVTLRRFVLRATKGTKRVTDEARFGHGSRAYVRTSSPR